MRRSKNYLLQEQSILLHLIKTLKEEQFEDEDSNKVTDYYIGQFKKKLNPEFAEKA